MADIYTVVVTSLAAWAVANSFTVSSEGVTLTDGREPDRVCMIYVISDVDGGFASNKRRNTRYRIQIDLGVPPDEKPSLPGYLEGAEEALMAAGGLPQGNRRMRDDDESAKAVISKDYIFLLAR